jgi:hypothetical protein
MFFDEDDEPEYGSDWNPEPDSDIEKIEPPAGFKEWFEWGMKSHSSYEMLSNVQLLNALRRFYTIDFSDPEVMKRLENTNPQFMDMYNRVFFTLHCMGFRRPMNTLQKQDIAIINTLIDQYSKFIFKNHNN